MNSYKCREDRIKKIFNLRPTMIKEKIRNSPILLSTKKSTILAVKWLRKNKRMKLKIKKLKD
jgi:hypothetical protein